MPANCTENVQSWLWKQWHNSCSKAKQLISVWTPAGGCWESWVVAVCFYQALTFRLVSNCCEACLRDCVMLLLEWASSASCTLCKCNRFQNLTPSFQPATTELPQLWSRLQMATSLPVPVPFPFMEWWKTDTCLSAFEAADLINCGRGEREEGRTAVAAWNVAHTMFVRMRWLLLSNSYRQQRKFFMLTSDIYWWYMFWHVFNHGVSLRRKTICILWQVMPLFPYCWFRTLTISISLPLVRIQLKEDGSSWTWLVLSVCVLEDAATSSLITCLFDYTCLLHVVWRWRRESNILFMFQVEWSLLLSAPQACC